jgi:hypothetical protein
LEAGIVYALLIYLLKAFDRQELQELGSIFSRRIFGDNAD